MMDKIPKPGEFYRDMENKLYQIVTVARFLETGEQLVVYQALYGGFEVRAERADRFCSRHSRAERPGEQPEERLCAKRVPEERPKERPGEERVPEERPKERPGEERVPEERPKERPGEERVPEERPKERPDEDRVPEECKAALPSGDETTGGAAAGLREPEPEPGPNPHLLEFLEADTYRAKRKALEKLMESAGEEEVESLCEVLDLRGLEGETAGKLRAIEKHLKMLEKYDGKRLR